MARRKKCYFCEKNVRYIDYKDAETNIRFTSHLAKIVPKYYTATCLNHQKAVSRALKRARFMGLIPFVNK